MRHSPTKSAPSTRSPSDSGTDTNRAGIRSLDCGHDVREDGARAPSPRAGDVQDGRPLAQENAISFGEQRQGV
jgi:hypothetical protein